MLGVVMMTKIISHETMPYSIWRIWLDLVDKRVYLGKTLT